MRIKLTDFNAKELEILIPEGVQVATIQNEDDKLVLRLVLASLAEQETISEPMQPGVIVEENKQETEKIEVSKKCYRYAPRIFQDEQNVKELQELREEGKNLKEIAQYFGTSISTIENAIRSLGLRRKIQYNSIGILQDEQRVKELQELREGGKTLGEIAQYFGVAISTVTNAIAVLGLKRKIQYNSIRIFQDEQKVKELQELREEGKTVVEIAQYFGVSISTVGNVIRSFGLQKKNTNKEYIPSCFKNHPEKIEEFFRLYDEGWAYNQLRDYFQISNKMIEKLFEHYHHPRRMQRSRAPKASLTGNSSSAQAFESEETKLFEEAENSVLSEKVESSQENIVLATSTMESQKTENFQREPQKVILTKAKERINNMEAFHRTFLPEEKGKILQAYKDGESLTNLANRLWVTRNVLKKFLMICGEKIRDGRKEIVCKSPHLTETEKEALFTAMAAGMTDEAIKGVISVTDSQLKYYRKQFRNEK